MVISPEGVPQVADDGRVCDAELLVVLVRQQALVDVGGADEALVCDGVEQAGRQGRQERLEVEQAARPRLASQQRVEVHWPPALQATRPARDG